MIGLGIDMIYYFFYCWTSEFFELLSDDFEDDYELDDSEEEDLFEICELGLLLLFDLVFSFLSDIFCC